MFKLADNREIGLYLKKLIYEKFNAQRQFCRKYIEDEGKVANDEEIGKMTNRLSQIIKGKKRKPLIFFFRSRTFCLVRPTRFERAAFRVGV